MINANDFIDGRSPYGPVVPSQSLPLGAAADEHQDNCKSAAPRASISGAPGGPRLVPEKNSRGRAGARGPGAAQHVDPAEQDDEQVAEDFDAAPRKSGPHYTYRENIQSKTPTKTLDLMGHRKTGGSFDTCFTFFVFGVCCVVVGVFAIGAMSLCCDYDLSRWS